ELALHALLAPARIGKNSRVSGTENDERVALSPQITVVAVDSHAVSDHGDDVDRIETRAKDVLRALSRDGGDRTARARKAVLNVQRLPRTLFLRLANTEAELAGHAVARFVDFARRAASDMEQ